MARSPSHMDSLLVLMGTTTVSLYIKALGIRDMGLGFGRWDRIEREDTRRDVLWLF